MTPGWYGKLPTLGDFASRRLDHDFVQVWDKWLAHGLAALRERNPDGWLDAYLQSAPWRFVLLPGVLPGALAGTTYAGVLMPSVDRVGRYFPLTLAAPVPALPRSEAEVGDWLNWLHRLDDVAVDALHDDWSIEELETQLARLTLPAPREPAAGEGDDTHAHGDLGALSAVFSGRQGVARVAAPAGRADLARLVAQATWSGSTVTWPPCSLWLTDAADIGVAPQLLATRGLPDTDTFAQLFTPTPRPA